jgi:hypothetical protein
MILHLARHRRCRRDRANGRRSRGCSCRGRTSEIGIPVERIEDLRPVRGRGEFIGDLTAFAISASRARPEQLVIFDEELRSADLWPVPMHE